MRILYMEFSRYMFMLCLISGSILNINAQLAPGAFTVDVDYEAGPDSDYTIAGRNYYSGNDHTLHFAKNNDNSTPLRENLVVKSLTTGGVTYDLTGNLAFPEEFKIRYQSNPPAGYPNRVMWYEAEPNNRDPDCCNTPTEIYLRPEYTNDLETAANSVIVNRGVDNMFSNPGGGESGENTIERVDQLWTSGVWIKDPSKAFIMLVEREGCNTACGNTQTVAPILSVDGSGLPASYGNSVSVSGSANYKGSVLPDNGYGNAQGRVQYTILKADNLTDQLAPDENSALEGQRLNFAVIPLSDLGIQPRQVFYGWSHLPVDKAGDNPTTFVDWNAFSTTSGDRADVVFVAAMFGDLLPPAALPVELITFSAEKDGNTVTLYWKTATEDNNSHFSVEHSTDGIRFEEIGRVDGNGTTDVEQSYSFTHNNPINGSNFYRLKQVDFDGLFEYTAIRHVRLKQAEDVIVFPNPAMSSIIISSDLDIKEMLIYDTTGRLLTEQDYVKGEMVDISDLAGGNYLLILKTKDRTIHHKFFKTR